MLEYDIIPQKHITVHITKYKKYNKNSVEYDTEICNSLCLKRKTWSVICFPTELPLSHNNWLSMQHHVCVSQQKGLSQKIALNDTYWYNHGCKFVISNIKYYNIMKPIYLTATA